MFKEIIIELLKTNQTKKIAEKTEVIFNNKATFELNVNLSG